MGKEEEFLDCCSRSSFGCCSGECRLGTWSPRVCAGLDAQIHCGEFCSFVLFKSLLFKPLFCLAQDTIWPELAMAVAEPVHSFPLLWPFAEKAQTLFGTVQAATGLPWWAAIGELPACLLSACHLSMRSLDGELISSHRVMACALLGCSGHNARSAHADDSPGHLSNEARRQDGADQVRA
jgi:hypothetical protein